MSAVTRSDPLSMIALWKRLATAISGVSGTAPAESDLFSMSGKAPDIPLSVSLVLPSDCLKFVSETSSAVPDVSILFVPALSVFLAILV